MTRRRPGPGAVADALALAWATADPVTRRLAQRTVETLNARTTVAALAERYARVGLEQRAGRLFEVMHALSFNQAAAARGSALRAAVTEWMPNGSATAPDDLRILDGNRVVARIQAKLLAAPARTAFEFGHDRYIGMQRLLASDKLTAVGDMLDKRLSASPDGVRYENYRDARALLTDSVTFDGVRGRGVAGRTVLRAARSPLKWANRQVAGAGAAQVTGAAASAAATSALGTGLAAAARAAARARAEETPASVAALTAAGSAAGRAAVDSGARAALREALRLGAASGALPGALTATGLAAAVSTAAYQVAEAGLGLARGESDAYGFAEQCCTAALSQSLAWGCGAVGQGLLPLPVVGALAGGLAGQAAAAVITHGLQVALVAARADRVAEERVALLEQEAVAAVLAAEALRAATTALGEERNAYVTEAVLPRIGRVQGSLAEGRPADAVAELAELTREFGGRPVCATVAEFDAWMAEPDAALTLDPNRPAPGAETEPRPEPPGTGAGA